MRHLVWSSPTFAIMLALGCGDSSEETADLSQIVYPDSLCGEKVCVANADEAGTCDPNSSDPDLIDCNAWRADGAFSLQAIKIDQSAKRGLPTPLERSDDDPCPPSSVSAKGEAHQCCQRVSEQTDKPAFRVTGLNMTKPPLFDLESVSSTSKMAIADDRYNWIVQLSSDEPGEVTLTAGLGLHNVDGSFAFADGPFEMGDTTWNKNGQWDPHVVPAVLGEDGSLRYAKQDLGARDFLVPLWDSQYEFPMLVLPLTGVELQTQLDADKLCAGYLKANMAFDQMGSLKAYLPLASLRASHLVFKKGDHGTGLCPLTANVTPADCDNQPVAEWGQ